MKTKVYYLVVNGRKRRETRSYNKKDMLHDFSEKYGLTNSIIETLLTYGVTSDEKFAIDVYRERV